MFRRFISTILGRLIVYAFIVRQHVAADACTTASARTEHLDQLLSGLHLCCS